MYYQTKNTIFSSNVGVNISAPTAKFHIKKLLGNGSVLNDGGEGSFYMDNTDPFLVESEFTNTFQGTTPDGTQANFIIKPNGRVGINTYNPTSTLHVEGTSYFKEDADFDDDVDIAGNTDITKSTTIGESLVVGGNTAIAQGLDVGQNVDVGNNLVVEGTTTMKDGLVIKGNSGTTNEIKLGTDGHIRAREVKVDLDNIPFPDYVFDEDYNLMTLNELRAFIDSHGHLPSMPSAQEVKEEGEISLKEMNLKLIEKVEELTLYVLEQEERINNLESINLPVKPYKND